MSVHTKDGWLTDHNVAGVAEAVLITKVHDAINAYGGADAEFSHLKARAVGVSALTKVYITKGLHQIAGAASALPEAHVTVEYTAYPANKRFHLYFSKFINRRGAAADWHPTKLTYVTAAAAVVTHNF